MRAVFPALGLFVVCQAVGQSVAAAPFERRSAEFRSIEGVAQKAAYVAVPTVDARVLPAGLKATDFTIETMLEEHLMTLDDLADHRAQAKVRPSGRRLCILVEKWGHRSAVLMLRQGKAWGVGQIWGNELANPVTGIVKMLRTGRKVDGDAFSLITVPGLQVTLVSHRENGVLMVTSVEDREDLNLTANVTRPAAKVFANLAKYARRWVAEAETFFPPSR